MTICEPCALREAGDTARAEAIESLRGQRLMLAFLQDSGDYVGRIVNEVGGCHDCIARLAMLYLGYSAESLVHICGGREMAIAATERGIAEDIYGQEG